MVSICFLARLFQRINQVGRFAAGADCQRHVARLAEQAQLIDEYARVIGVVADCGHGRDVGHQGIAGNAARFSMIGMGELDRKVQRIAQAAAVAHGQQFFALAETRPPSPCSIASISRGILLEKFLLHFDALAAFAQDLVAETFRRFVDGGVAVA